MNVTISGIKCDNPGCGWHNDDVPFEDYEHWVGRPCPKCGDNLLTQADYDAVKRLMKICGSKPVRFIEKIYSLFDSKRYTFDLGMNGSGRIKCKKIATKGGSHGKNSSGERHV